MGAASEKAGAQGGGGVPEVLLSTCFSRQQPHSGAHLLDRHQEWVAVVFVPVLLSTDVINGSGHQQHLNRAQASAPACHTQRGNAAICACAYADATSDEVAQRIGIFP